MLRVNNKLKNNGFTLVEVLLSIAIMAIMTTLIWSSLHRTLNAREFVQQVDEKYHGVRIAMNRIAKEISMAFLSKHQLYDKRTETMFVAKDSKPIDELVFTSLSHLRMIKDANESDQNVIHYYGERDEDDPSITNLMRREMVRILDKDENENMDNGVSYILAENVVEFDLKFWDDQGLDWIDEWDSTEIEKAWRLPRWVQIQLTVNDERGRETTFITKTEIYLLQPFSWKAR